MKYFSKLVILVVVVVFVLLFVVVIVMLVFVVLCDGVCNFGEFCYYYNSDNVGLIFDFVGLVGNYGMM